jgi:ribonuclease T2
MYKKAIFSLLFIASGLIARESLIATKSCGAFNNMKHTTNRGNVVLQLNHTYESIREYKGQNLILIDNATPKQRWVDSSCFKKQSKPTKIRQITQKESKQISTENLLALSWHNAFCQTHQYKKECKRGVLSRFKKGYSDDRFVLHGLWPQPKNNQYCNLDQKYITMDKYKYWNKLPSLNLSDDIKKQLQMVMPGVSSNLHRHEWYKHGTCYGKDANGYFADAIDYVKTVNSSKLGMFFVNNTGKKVSLKQIRKVVDDSFGKGAGNSVELRCNNGMITELWLHLKGNSDNLSQLLKSNHPIRSFCRSGFIDKAGFGR